MKLRPIFFEYKVFRKLRLANESIQTSIARIKSPISSSFYSCSKSGLFYLLCKTITWVLINNIMLERHNLELPTKRCYIYPPSSPRGQIYYLDIFSVYTTTLTIASSFISYTIRGRTLLEGSKISVSNSLFEFWIDPTLKHCTILQPGLHDLE